MVAWSQKGGWGEREGGRGDVRRWPSLNHAAVHRTHLQVILPPPHRLTHLQEPRRQSSNSLCLLSERSIAPYEPPGLIPVGCERKPHLGKGVAVVHVVPIVYDSEKGRGMGGLKGVTLVCAMG